MGTTPVKFINRSHHKIRKRVNLKMKCKDCGRVVLSSVCEKHNPRGAKICKDCCIKRDGHKCEWFSMCW